MGGGEEGAEGQRGCKAGIEGLVGEVSNERFSGSSSKWFGRQVGKLLGR